MLLLSLIACPLPAPPDTGVSELCELELPDPVIPALQSCPVETTFDPVVKWQWSDCELGVVVTPVVGDIDGDGVGDVAFSAFDVTGVNGFHQGELLLLSGDGSVTELWHVTEIPFNGETYIPSSRGNIAMGDLDLDGIPEVCAVVVGAHVVCMNYDGTPTPVVKFVVENPGWLNDDWNATTGAPAIANMTGDTVSDAQGELVWGNIIYDHTGVGETSPPVGFGSPGGLQGQAYNGQIGHADDDGHLELITARSDWDMDEQITYQWVVDGMAASADLDGDGSYEVITTFTDIWDPDGWSTWLGWHQGAVNETTELGNGAWTGGPTIAQMDDDDPLEIAVSGLTHLQVWEYDPASLEFVNQLNLPIHDTSSSMLSSAAVDWDHDGVWELLYGDEDDLYLLDVATGVNLFDGTAVDPSLHESSSRTESPSVADLEGDGSLEFIVPSSRVPGNPDQWSGITVIGSATDSWAGTGRVWNQANFVPGRVDDDLAVVPAPGDNPDGWRAAESYPPSVGDDLAELVIVDAERCEDCPELHTWVAVANVGLADAGPFVMSAYGDGLLMEMHPIPGLASGDAVWVGPLITTTQLDVQWVADSLDEVDECDEDNNTFDYLAHTCG